MSDPTQARRGQRGFTLIEVIVTVAVMGILIMIGLPTFLGTLNRARLTGSTRQLATFFQVARLESIKKGAWVEVNYDPNLRRFFAYRDNDRDGTQDATEERIAAVIDLPIKLEFRGPGDALPNGAEAIDGWDNAPVNEGPIFRPDGSADRVGAFRLHGTGENYLEVRIDTPATGRIILRKWDKDQDVFYEHVYDDGSWLSGYAPPAGATAWPWKWY